MSSNSVSLHRVLKTSPEKLFRAFTQPAAIAFWLPPLGWQESLEKLAKLVEPEIPDA